MGVLLLLDHLGLSSFVSKDVLALLFVPVFFAIFTLQIEHVIKKKPIVGCDLREPLAYAAFAFLEGVRDPLSDWS